MVQLRNMRKPPALLDFEENEDQCVNFWGVLPPFEGRRVNCEDDDQACDDQCCCDKGDEEDAASARRKLSSDDPVLAAVSKCSVVFLVEM